MPEVTGGQKTLGKTASFLGIVSTLTYHKHSHRIVLVAARGSMVRDVAALHHTVLHRDPPGAPSSPIEYFNSRVYHFYLESSNSYHVVFLFSRLLPFRKRRSPGRDNPQTHRLHSLLLHLHPPQHDLGRDFVLPAFR
jgi:hypothetical protein